MCSYCGCQSIDIIGRFTAEHEQIINAAGELRRAVESSPVSSPSGTVADHVDALARIRAGEHDLVPDFYRQLRSHIEREEDGLFPASLTTLGGSEWEEVDARTAAVIPSSPIASA